MPARAHPPSAIYEALKANSWSRVAAAKALGIHARTVIKNIPVLERMGYTVEKSEYDRDRAAHLIREAEAAHEAAPEGFNVKGVSTLYNADGKMQAQWVKTTAEQKGPADWEPIVKAAFADTTPVRTVPRPKHCTDDLLTVYPIGDHHVAMYAWGEETGADYDIKIAERLLVNAVAHLVDTAPPSRTALIVDVGDFFHVDNLKNETARSGHTLDMDTRYAAMIGAGVKMLRACIEKALAKHEQVKLICSPGNHNDLGALWLQLALSLLYERNPRVSVEKQPGKFHYHRHGSTLLGVTHGDTVKLEKLGGVMAHDRAEDWGATKHRYWLTGHIHSRSVLELPGVMVESFRTLAPRDAWAQGAGYRSGRDMLSIVYHAKHGEIARNRFDVSMVEGT